MSCDKLITDNVDPKHTDVTNEANALGMIVYTYSGKIHHPSFVHVQELNSDNFNGMLNLTDISYTWCNPDGNI
nr:hypothetical protein [uncultured Chryseobacterium sp.]